MFKSTKLYWFLLLICFLSLNSTWAQRPPVNLDSIRQVLATTEPDSNHVRLLRTLAWNVERDSVDYYFDKAAATAKALNLTDLLINTLNYHGNYYQNIKIYEKSKAYYTQSLRLAEAAKRIDLLAWGQHDLGLALYRLGQSDSAFHYFSLAEKHFIESGQNYALWKVYTSKGKLFQSLSKGEEARPYYEKAYEIVKDSKNRGDKGYCLYLAAENAYYRNDFDRYGYYRLEWEEFQADRPKRNNWIKSDPKHTSLFNMFDRQDSISLKRLQKALDYYRDQERYLDEAITYSDLYLYYKGRGNFEKALWAIKKADSTYIAVNNQKLRSVLLGSGYILTKQMGEESQALAYLEEHMRLSDSLQIDNQMQTIRELETLLETSEKDRQLALADIKIQRNSMQRNLLLLGIIILAVLALAIYYSQTQKIKHAKVLAEREKQLTAYNATLEGQESERKRIAQDLHDGLGGLLTTVKAQFGQLSNVDDNQEGFNRTNALIDEACSEVRRISHNMMPLSLSIAGLGPALEDLANNLSSSGLETELEVINAPVERVNPNRELMLFRIIQELCNNSQKHAQAKNVLIQLIFEKEQLQLLVEDDGQGFDLAQARSKSGLGINGIESRVELLNGTIEWDSIANEGTSVNINIPLSAAEHSSLINEPSSLSA